MATLSKYEFHGLVARQKDVLYENLRKYFAVDKYADLTIITKEESIKVHKIVLMAQSECLKGALEKGFEKSGSNEAIHMDDDPNGLKGCLAHLYGIHFDVRARCENSETSIGEIANEVELAKYHVALFAVANKYRIEDLCTRTRLVLMDLVKEFLNQDPKSVLEVARCIWTTHEKHARDLRRPLANTIFEEAAGSKGFENLEAWCSPAPGLWAEVRAALVRQEPDRFGMLIGLYNPY